MEDGVQIYLDDWLHPMVMADHFAHPEKPLIIDVGCGKGRFLLARSQHHPDVNYLGVDRMMGRLRRIEKRVRKLGLDHVRLLRFDAYYATQYLFPKNAVRTYFIFFPDPWPKRRHHRHRLLDDRYMDALHATLEDGGAVHFATDHWPYYEDVMRRFERDDRFEATELFVPDDDEQTDFERLYIKEKPIGRCSCLKR